MRLLSRRFDEVFAVDHWMHVLQVESEGLVARVTLNGVEVFAEWEGASRIAQTKVDPMIVEGANALEVELTPMTDDEGRPLAIDTVFRLELIRGVHGEDPGDAGRVARWAWDAGRYPVEPGELSGVWARQFMVADEQAHGRWAWQDAPSAAAQPIDPLDLVAVVRAVHDALVARDVAAVESLTALKSDEMARALGVDVSEVIEGQREMWAEVFADPDWRVEPFDPAAIAAVPMAEGRLVKLTDPYGAPPVKGSTSERAVGFPIVVTRVNGAWVIAR